MNKLGTLATISWILFNGIGLGYALIALFAMQNKNEGMMRLAISWFPFCFAAIAGFSCIAVVTRLLSGEN